MSGSAVFITIAIVAFLAIGAAVLIRKGGGRPLTPLASVAFALVLAGIIFGENRAVGYSLIGVGVAVAIADMYLKGRRGR